MEDLSLSKSIILKFALRLLLKYNPHVANQQLGACSITERQDYYKVLPRLKIFCRLTAILSSKTARTPYLGIKCHLSCDVYAHGVTWMNVCKALP